MLPVGRGIFLHGLGWCCSASAVTLFDGSNLGDGMLWCPDSVEGGVRLPQELLHGAEVGVSETGLDTNGKPAEPQLSGEANFPGVTIGVIAWEEHQVHKFFPGCWAKFIP